jgi:hypothetical protein
MIQKRRFKKDNVTKVTFVLPADVAGETIHLLGDFNKWQVSQAMKKQKDRSWRLTVNLKPALNISFVTCLTSKS